MGKVLERGCGTKGADVTGQRSHSSPHPSGSPNKRLYTGLESDAKFSESLEGLRVIQLVRPTVFNFVLPKLLKTPMPLNSIRLVHNGRVSVYSI